MNILYFIFTFSIGYCSFDLIFFLMSVGGNKIQGGCPIEDPLFTKILPDLGRFSARLWLIFANFSNVGMAAAPPPSPLSPTPMFFLLLFFVLPILFLSILHFFFSLPFPFSSTLFSLFQFFPIFLLQTNELPAKRLRGATHFPTSEKRFLCILQT